MSDLGNKEIMATNIKRYLSQKGMTMKDLSRAIDVPYTTVCSWCKMDSYPRIDKIEKMANLFKISKSDLVEDPAKVSPDAERYAVMQEIYDRNKILFDAAVDAPVEAVEKAAEYLVFLKSQKG